MTKHEINNSIINELKAQIKEQEKTIYQLAETNRKLMSILDNISAAEMPDTDDAIGLCEITPVEITREFIEFTVIRKIKNAIIPGVKSSKAAIELAMLIKEELSEHELVDQFNRIIDKYIYQKMYESSDSGLERAVNLLKELGYEKIEAPKGSPATGPYWERTIGGGVRVDVLYRAPFKLANGSDCLYLKGICSTR